MIFACLFESRIVTGLSPIPQKFIAQLSYLFNGDRFGFISRSALGYGLIHQIRNRM